MVKHDKLVWSLIFKLTISPLVEITSKYSPVKIWLSDANARFTADLGSRSKQGLLQPEQLVGLSYLVQIKFKCFNAASLQLVVNPGVH